LQFRRLEENVSAVLRLQYSCAKFQPPEDKGQRKIFMQSAQSQAARRHMIDSQLRTNGITAPWVVAAMGAIPREDFLPAEKAAFAYQDRSVPLGNGHMLNPPLATAQMLQVADIGSNDTVLIVGASTGYLAALLAARTNNITAVDVDTALAGDTSHGAPYDVILIDGAIAQLPAHIESQLAEGGRIVTGLAEGAVSRLAMGTKHGGHVALRPFADLEVAPLPGFERAKEFTF
jgi:protein-L-isoaspartate(D-aspartate) O-methyltransferase